MLKQKRKKCKKKCTGKNNFFNPSYTSSQPNAKKYKPKKRQKKKGGILQTVPFYQMNPIAQANILPEIVVFPLKVKTVLQRTQRGLKKVLNKKTLQRNVRKIKAEVDV